MKVIKTYKPITPSLRKRVVIREEGLHKGQGLKSLMRGKISTGGRNNTGRITMRRRGGGHKRRYREIDNLSKTLGYSCGEVLRIEYDPNRSGNIALCKLESGRQLYILAATGLKVKDKISGHLVKKELKEEIGSTRILKGLGIGTEIYNLNGKYIRSAGTSGQILKQEEKETIIRLPSKEIIKVSNLGIASLGRVSNIEHRNRNMGKAGGYRWLGCRPRVKGVKMNPIDHPHGGKTPVAGGLGGAPRTKWGKLAKWTKKNKIT